MINPGFNPSVLFHIVKHAVPMCVYCIYRIITALILIFDTTHSTTIQRNKRTHYQYLTYGIHSHCQCYT